MAAMSTNISAIPSSRCSARRPTIPTTPATRLRAALDCCARLEELNGSAAAFGGRTVAQRIGINSGDALVGNFGSRRRFNYSVMSDAVNLASRLEGANKFYGTTVIASETTVALTGETFAWRELDTIRVKGRSNQLKIYQLLALARSCRLRKPRSRRITPTASRTGAPANSTSPRNVSRRSAEADRPSRMFLERAKIHAQQAPVGRMGPGPDPAGKVNAAILPPAAMRTAAPLHVGRKVRSCSSRQARPRSYRRACAHPLPSAPNEPAIP